MPRAPRTVGITGRTDVDEATEVAREVCRLCRDYGLEVVVDESLGIEGVETADVRSLGETSDVIITIGGDGTILRVSRLTSEHEVPILGVNLGKFGFLTEVGKDEIRDAVRRLAEGEFEVEERSKLLVEVGGEERGDVLNEVTVITSRPAKMIQYGLLIDGFEVERAWADGVLISTPTGSTAYSLSAGGPIVEPEVECTIITPLNPFKLEARPMVVSMDRRIEVEVHDPDRAEVVLDGQKYLKFDEPVIVRRSPRKALFVRFDSSYFERLREKFLG